MTTEHNASGSGRHRGWHSLPALVLLLAVTATGVRGEPGTDPVAAAEGLWAYTGLVTGDGQSLPLTGIFLIRDGMFLQQSIFNGEPFSDQGAMAHAGPYRGGGAGLRLTSEQTLSMDPGAASPLTSLGSREHDLAVTRDGDSLTLQFGGGTSTIQTFRRLGDADGADIHHLADGALALADGHFILVSGNERRAVTGYGRYERDGEALELEVIRWAEADAEGSRNLRDLTLTATLDSEALVLADGRRFAIVDGGAASP